MTPEHLDMAVAFYDVQIGHGAIEHAARELTIYYLCRKAPDLDYCAAASRLANALARRATIRITGATP